MTWYLRLNQKAIGVAENRLAEFDAGGLVIEHTPENRARLVKAIADLKEHRKELYEKFLTE